MGTELTANEENFNVNGEIREVHRTSLHLKSLNSICKLRQSGLIPDCLAMIMSFTSDLLKGHRVELGEA